MDYKRNFSIYNNCSCYNNGSSHLCVLSRNRLLFSRLDGWLKYSDYDEKFNIKSLISSFDYCGSKFDIMEVYTTSQKFDSDHILATSKIKEVVNKNLLKCIWRRE